MFIFTSNQKMEFGTIKRYHHVDGKDRGKVIPNTQCWYGGPKTGTLLLITNEPIYCLNFPKGTIKIQFTAFIKQVHILRPEYENSKNFFSMGTRDAAQW